MNPKILFLFLSSILYYSFAHSSVTISLELGRLTSSESVTLPGGTLWALIGENSSGGLPGGLQVDGSLYSNSNTSLILNDFAGATINKGNIVGGGVILATGPTSNSVPGDINSNLDFNIADYASGVNEGDVMGIYWFPGLTTSSNQLPTNSFDIGGFHRTNENSVSGGNAGLVVPPDTASGITIAYFDNELTSGSSGIPQTELHAVAVPEASTFFMVAISLLVLINRRLPYRVVCQ